jgi:hypothetical protein
MNRDNLLRENCAAVQKIRNKFRVRAFDCEPVQRYAVHLGNMGKNCLTIKEIY